MEKEKFIALLSKSLSGQTNPKENEMLNNLLLENEEYRFIALQLEGYFQHKANLNPNLEQLDKVWEMIRSAEKEDLDEKFDYLSSTKSTWSFNGLLKIAALLVILSFSGTLGYKLWNKHGVPDFENLIATSEKTFKILDDGTKIWLNKDSKLSYNTAFGKHKREIMLEGEAYFDVVKNTAIPLFIHAGAIDIEVKGTVFNVNAYKDRDDIQVALVSGLIQVTDKLAHTQKVLLHPNEKYILNSARSLSKPRFIVTSMVATTLLKDINWIADTLTFNKEKLSSLVIRMEKKFDCKITIESGQLKEKRFSGTFINENIQQALAALKLSYPFTYTINNRLVVIKDEK